MYKRIKPYKLPLFNLYKYKNYHKKVNIIIKYNNDSKKNNLTNQINHKLNDVDNNKLKLQLQLQLQSIKEYDFEKIFPSEEFSVRSLTQMHDLIKETKGAKEWIINDGNIYSDHEMCKYLVYHDKTNELGHTGGTLRWTIGTLRKMYIVGWNNWINEYFNTRRK